METLIVITDLTRMQGQRVCIAGITRDLTCIRPVFRHGGLAESWLYDQGNVAIRPFAVILFDLQEHAPDPPHTEDWIIDLVYRPDGRILTQDRQRSLLRRIEDTSVEGIFGAEILREHGWYIAAGEGTRSLGTIRVKKLWDIWYALHEGDKWSYHLLFSDQTGQRYRLAVTDLAFRTFLDHLRLHQGMQPSRAAQSLTTTLQRAELFLRIGLARGWEKYPARCYLQITGVYSFPDYLEGRCFADFDLSDEGLPF